MLTKTMKLSQASAALFLICGCSTSHIVVGPITAPISPDNVRVFLTPPAHYETVALITSDSNASFQFTGQGKIDAALNRAKRDAAKLGANGLILNRVGESGSVTVGSVSSVQTGNVSTGSFVGSTAGGLVKNVTVIAIRYTDK